MKTLKQLAKEIWKNAKRKGFHDEHIVCRIQADADFYVEKACNNLHDEISELHDAWRRGILNEPCDKPIKLSFLEEELADILIRTLDFCEHFALDPDKIVKLKMAYNSKRPFKHGNKKS